VDAVAIYAGGRTGQQAVAGREMMECVPCDENLPGVVAELIQSQRFPAEPVSDWTPSNALPAVASWTRVRQLSAMGSEAGGD